jgi:hypothetical protein
MKQYNTADLRLQTINYWATFTHARNEVDVARVHAFQALVRENEDLSILTDKEVSEAYGGRGWAPIPVCIECGAREDTNVLFGEKEVPVCLECLTKAVSFDKPKKNFLTRLLGN